MKEVVVKIAVIEPLMLRGPGEFDPSARGVTSGAQSLSWPSPSTLAGFLLSQLVRQVPGRAPSWGALLEKYEELMSGAGLRWIRGPYFISEKERVYVPLLLGEAFLVDWNQLSYYFGDLLKSLEEGRVGEVAEKLRRHRLPVQHQERVGISLRSREGVKAVREGFLYSATFACFPRGSFAVEVGAESEPALSGRVSTFGGESRIVQVQVGGEPWLSEMLSSFTGGYAILLSPLVIPATLELDEKSGTITANGIKIAKLVTGRIGAKGLGYAIAERTRKPVYPAVLEGSILYFESCSGDAKAYGAYACIPGLQKGGLWDIARVLGTLGFGSFAVLRTGGGSEHA